MELSPDVKECKPKVGDSEFFQEWMERAHSQKGREKETERRKDVNGSQHLAPSVVSQGSWFTQEFLVTLLVLRVVGELT